MGKGETREENRSRGGEERERGEGSVGGAALALRLLT